MRIQTARTVIKQAVMIIFALGIASGLSAQTASINQTVAFRIVIPERAPLGFNYKAAAELLSTSTDARGNRLSHWRDQYGGGFQSQVRQAGSTALRLTVSP